jgi:hypothetical protein
VLLSSSFAPIIFSSLHPQQPILISPSFFLFKFGSLAQFAPKSLSLPPCVGIQFVWLWNLRQRSFHFSSELCCPGAHSIPCSPCLVGSLAQFTPKSLSAPPDVSVQFVWLWKLRQRPFCFASDTILLVPFPLWCQHFHSSFCKMRTQLPPVDFLSSAPPPNLLTRPIC